MKGLLLLPAFAAASAYQVESGCTAEKFECQTQCCVDLCGDSGEYGSSVDKCYRLLPGGCEVNVIYKCLDNIAWCEDDAMSAPASMILNDTIDDIKVENYEELALTLWNIPSSEGTITVQLVTAGADPCEYRPDTMGEYTASKTLIDQGRRYVIDTEEFLNGNKPPHVIGLTQHPFLTANEYLLTGLAYYEARARVTLVKPQSAQAAVVPKKSLSQPAPEIVTALSSMIAGSGWNRLCPLFNQPYWQAHQKHSM
eukprot:Blabericola_migrator_1__1307@NODE_133_length_13242_cov_100_720987_g17_i1_p6_GENE_NODE_133_length_13242_cov_100_720987_g17_i1NODE_133_length_13242_cov_100_720987_g17_i1_p6_ORF_typecomplete_len254_score24_36_NODE_133_length_13242_cov_100_720987_g17_i117542515